MVAPVPPGTDRLAAVRAALPALDAGIYLNTGSVGPMPAETAAAMAEITEFELRTGRAHVAYVPEALQRMAEARASVAAVLTADVDDIALTHAATDGMSIGVWSIDWRAGDRAVTTNLEHPGGIGALYTLRDRIGVELAFVDVTSADDPGAILEAFDRLVDDRTRAVVVSHVLWASGAVMPVAGISALAHARGAIVVIDGAQSVGAMPVDLAATGADVYAVAGQKWLLGPEGMGAVAVASTALDRLRPAFAGYYSFEAVDSSGMARPWPDARRFETSNFHRPSVVGLARSIGWLSMFVGWDWIHERGAAMARQAHDRLSAIDGVHVITPRDRMATLVTFRIAGWDAAAALEEIGSRVFAIARVVPVLEAIRISVGFFTTDDELDRFAGAVALLAAHTPETLPRRPRLTILGEG